MGKVSVIIPIYNVKDYIAECLDSVINQDYKNLEIICVNDGTPDNSMGVVQKFSEKDNRIKIINKENGGLSSARNAGIDVATGDYIYFIDSDDFISADYIAGLVDAINAKNNVKVALNPKLSLYYTKDNQEIKTTAVNFKENKLSVVAWNKLYDMEFFKKVNLKFYEGIKYEDYEFWNRFVANIDDIAISEQGIYFYRQREDSIMGQRQANSKYDGDILLAINSIVKYFNDNPSLTPKPLNVSVIASHYKKHTGEHKRKFKQEMHKTAKAISAILIKQMSLKNKLYTYLLKSKII